ncbi:MAG TPA: hypothetical protein VFF53_12760 [Geobacteraceae bacterium]|nr:hypothetical protein [Geobacteraceae bacterium]
MKRVCAWCNKGMESEDDCSPGDDALVTHGICSDCTDNMEFQLGVSIRKFLNSFSVPVLLVDGERRMISANRSALQLVKKELGTISHELVGNVFECAYSRLPGGCGKSVHCSGCVIRNAINSTYATGEPASELPASIASDSSSRGNTLLSFLISTEKVLNYVLLRIERFDPHDLHVDGRHAV